jgi:hypothetical protein
MTGLTMTEVLLILIISDDDDVHGDVHDDEVNDDSSFFVSLPFVVDVEG